MKYKKEAQEVVKSCAGKVKSNSLIFMLGGDVHTVVDDDMMNYLENPNNDPAKREPPKQVRYVPKDKRVQRPDFSATGKDLSKAGTASKQRASSRGRDYKTAKSQGKIRRTSGGIETVQSVGSAVLPLIQGAVESGARSGDGGTFVVYKDGITTVFINGSPVINYKSGKDGIPISSVSALMESGLSNKALKDRLRKEVGLCKALNIWGSEPEPRYSGDLEGVVSFSKDVKDQMKELYTSGARIVDISKKLGLTRRQVYSLINALDLKPRQNRVHWSKAQERVILNYSRFLNMAEISEIMDMDRHKVYNKYRSMHKKAARIEEREGIKANAKQKVA